MMADSAGRPASRRNTRWRWLTAALALFALPAAIAETAPLQGAWRPAQPGDRPATVLLQAARGELHRFDPSRLTLFPRGDHGAWIVLHPRPPGLPGRRVLSIPSPPFGRITLYDRHGPLRSTALTDSDRLGGGGLAFTIPSDWSATAPLLLKLEPAETLDAPIRFRLQDRRSYARSEVLWVALASASFGVMLAMAAMALCFAAALRDTTFAWYAGYVGSFVLLMSIQTGYLFQPLGLSALAALALPVGSAATGISAACAVMFMMRFCALDRYAPRFGRLLAGLALTLILLVLVRWLGWTPARRAAQAALNPLLLLGALCTLSGAVLALLRGSRYAAFFLIGWLPLLTLVAASSAQVDGALPGVDWLHNALLPGGALESIILSLGLADRALMLRRDHRVVKSLADQDPLTGILNRRAWLTAAEARLADSRRRARALLFLDLDHFKILNDRFGHAAGDEALLKLTRAIAEELRPGDLFGRFGGDELVILLDDAGPGGGRRVADRLRERIRALGIPADRDGRTLDVSIGLATARDDDSLSRLIERADAAMYAAKSAARGEESGDNQATGEAPAATAAGTPSVRVARDSSPRAGGAAGSRSDG